MGVCGRVPQCWSPGPRKGWEGTEVTPSPHRPPCPSDEDPRDHSRTRRTDDFPPSWAEATSPPWAPGRIPRHQSAERSSELERESGTRLRCGTCHAPSRLCSLAGLLQRPLQTSHSGQPRGEHASPRPRRKEAALPGGALGYRFPSAPWTRAASRATSPGNGHGWRCAAGAGARVTPWACRAGTAEAA